MSDSKFQFQYFWRCAHHPSCFENFFSHRTTCEWMCHATPLRSYDAGVHQLPKSWGERHGMGSIADQIFGM